MEGLSISICSINNEFKEIISKNIISTIGDNIEFELLIFDNKEKNLPICQVYNNAIEISKYDYIIFIHEDCTFLTKNWGEIILDLFKKEKNLGIFGIAGSKIKLKAPSYWSCSPENYHVKHIYQNGRLESIGFPENRNQIKCAVVDGVFIAMKKHIHLKFDENLKGFHGYDMDISIKCKILNLKVLVINSININHNSEGNRNSAWLESLIQISNNYDSYLPINFSDNKKLENLESDILIKNFHVACDLGKFDIAKSIFHSSNNLSMNQKIKLNYRLIFKR